MDELRKHLGTSDTGHLGELHAKTNSWGHTTRLLYRHLYTAFMEGCHEMRITAERIELFRDEKRVMYAIIGPLERRFNDRTFRKSMIAIIEHDAITSSHLRLLEHTQDQVICELLYYD